MAAIALAAGTLVAATDPATTPSGGPERAGLSGAVVEQAAYTKKTARSKAAPKSSRKSATRSKSKAKSRTRRAVPRVTTPAPAPAPAPALAAAPVAVTAPVATTVPVVSAPVSAPASAPASLALPTLPWWGGPAYYARFPKAAASGWTSPSFFPIAVFYGKPEHAPTLASLGINTYMGAEHDGSKISTITSTGISVIAQEEWTAAELGNDPRVVGLHASDECEMGYSGCDVGADTEQTRLAVQSTIVSRLRARSDGRFLQANFGNGVLGTWWAPTTMSSQVGLVDVSSVDKYAYTSPAVRDVISGSPFWPTGADPKTAATYGWLEDRMETFSTPAASKPNWVFVETAKPYLTEDGASTISSAQIGGAVWSAIIHGAAGISYFQHNNNGCGTYSLVWCSSALQDSVRTIDAEVTALAPVINTPSYAWSFGPGLDTALKAQDGSAYILAMSTGTPGSRTFTLPPGVAGTSVEVVGENRSIPVVNGGFTDGFEAEYAHHVYRVSIRG